jgi:cytochrome c-type biogenesis protein CcmE
MRNAKFLVGGLLIVAAVIYLIVSSTQASSQYFLTIEELQARKTEIVGRDVRVSGAVIGDSIKYDPQSLSLTFTVANIPNDNNVIDARGGLAAVLKDAVVDNSLARMNVVYNGVKPDLLKDQAQAIMTGTYNADGTFTANELLLKCPTKYEDAVPAQAQ